MGFRLFGESFLLIDAYNLVPPTWMLWRKGNFNNGAVFAGVPVVVLSWMLDFNVETWISNRYMILECKLYIPTDFLSWHLRSNIFRLKF